MKKFGRTGMYNHFRDYRNDQWSLIFGLALGWLLDSHFDYSATAAGISALVGGFVLRIFICYTPWTESIRWDSDENIYSTPWQPMTQSQEVAAINDDVGHLV
ncbi:MAG TPA: hypothetical protein VLA52_01320 [Thermohalobaculum sp.]|nr:hypothetical protein [Thermohalobaculum sp.]